MQYIAIFYWSNNIAIMPKNVEKMPENVRIFAGCSMRWVSEFCSNFTIRIAISEVTAILTAISQVAAIIIDKLQYIAIFYWSNNIAIIFNKYIFPRVSRRQRVERAPITITR